LLVDHDVCFEASYFLPLASNTIAGKEEYDKATRRDDGGTDLITGT
jgi:hypothetical protein